MYLQKLLSLPPYKSIAVIGIGQENLQFLDWLLRVVKLDPSRILLADSKSVDLSNPILSIFTDFPKNIFVGQNYLDVLKLESVSIVFKAPGIWSLKPEFIDFRIKNGEDSILGSLVFFYEKYRTQIVTITGTKGKSTTSSLLNQILNQSSSLTTHYCGNTTNISPYKFWQNLDQSLNKLEYFIIEASSFQLQDLAYPKLSSQYGIITNYYIDHQDQHATAEEYWLAKDSTFAFQNKGEHTLVTQSVFDKTQSKDKTSSLILVDTNLAQTISDYFTICLEGSHNQLNLAQAVLAYLQIMEQFNFTTENTDILHKLIIKHKPHIQASLDTYQPLSHRQEIFSTSESQVEIKSKLYTKTLPIAIRFIDDGAATEPDAVVAAIDTLTAKPNQYLWLFIAGKDKGGKMNSIAESILKAQMQTRLYKINYCGQVGQNLLAFIYNLIGLSITPPLENFKNTAASEFTSKEEIIKGFQFWLNEQRKELEETNQTEKITSILEHKIELNIVLSPCGSSQDEFTNYIERAGYFKNCVSNLK
jgi:UDP-N-acetylmuramoylalanine-D-glutamate ligase